MSVATFQGVVENGQVRLPSDVHLPENATVYVVVPDAKAKPSRAKFDLVEMIARMPADYQAVEEGFGPPVGKEAW
ncbi:MAG: hypothetical protein JWL77_2601 [Chthonomonadaceae bacterium]|nr:hypothetical protein [Chthonomonadaceae bacterium]